jgi:DNA-binding HxlR family transcriptional regulator
MDMPSPSSPASSPAPDCGDPSTPLTGHAQCLGVSEILGRIGDKWTVLVVMSLRGRPRRVNDNNRHVGGISQQMLTRTLRLLERDGMVARTVHPTTPPQVEYALTPLGRSLSEPVMRLGEWAVAHIATIHAHREDYDAGR